MTPRKLRTRAGGPAEAKNRRLVAEKLLEVADLASSEDGATIDVTVGIAGDRRQRHHLHGGDRRVLLRPRPRRGRGPARPRRRRPRQAACGARRPQAGVALLLQDPHHQRPHAGHASREGAREGSTRSHDVMASSAPITPSLVDLCEPRHSAPGSADVRLGEAAWDTAVLARPGRRGAAERVRPDRHVGVGDRVGPQAPQS